MNKLIAITIMALAFTACAEAGPKEDAFWQKRQAAIAKLPKEKQMAAMFQYIEDKNNSEKILGFAKLPLWERMRLRKQGRIP
jgi:hypothetical protein